MLTEEQREARRREEEQRRKLHAAKLREAARLVFKIPEARFLFGEFFHDAGMDVSPMRDTDRATYHAIGWQDSGSWWVNAIRAHCPEREAEIRKERIAYLKEAARGASQDETDAS